MKINMQSTHNPPSPPFRKGGRTPPLIKGRLRRERSAEWLGGILCNSKGISILFLVIAMLLMITIGYALTYLIPTKQKSVLFPIQSTQAFFLAQSGVEFAVRYAKDQGWTTPTQLLGLNGGAVYQRNLGTGRFTINYNNTTDTLTSSGEVPIGTQRRQIVLSNFTSFLYYFTYRKSITVQAGQVSNGPHTNFPMLVSMTDPNLATTASGGHVASYDAGTNDPRDIIFEALDDTTCGGAGTAPCRLNHEIETYVATTGQLVAWVRVPSINNGTVIYMYYGNNCITTSTQNKTGVWNTNYLMVHHLKESSGTLNDSTQYNHPSNAASGVTYGATGNIGSGLSFDEVNDYYTIADFDYNDTFTISMWEKVTDNTGNYYQYMYSHDVYLANPCVAMFLGEATCGDFADRNDTITYVYDNIFSVEEQRAEGATINAADGSWHYITLVRVRNGTNVLYIDGASRDTYWAPNTDVNPAGSIYIGRRRDGNIYRYFGGTLDEIRISNTNRSAGWVLTEYRNQNAPASFYSLGAEQN